MGKGQKKRRDQFETRSRRGGGGGGVTEKHLLWSQREGIGAGVQEGKVKREKIGKYFRSLSRLSRVWLDKSDERRA